MIFVAEQWKIASDKQSSENTANIAYPLIYRWITKRKWLYLVASAKNGFDE